MVHPPPGLVDVPSYPALVGSVDSNVSKYVAITGVQGSRVEIIENLEGMCKVRVHASSPLTGTYQI